MESPYSEKQNFFLKTPPQNALQISVDTEGIIFLKNRGTKTPLFSAYGEECDFFKNRGPKQPIFLRIAKDIFSEDLKRGITKHPSNLRIVRKVFEISAKMTSS